MTSSGFVSANNSSLEMMQDDDDVYGYDINRITTALNGFRSGLVTLVGPTIETNLDPLTLGGVLIDNTGIKVIADGTTGVPAGTIVWNSQTTGQFTTAQFFPVYGGYQQVDGTYRAKVRFYIPTTVTKLIKIYLSFTLQPFHVGHQTTAVASTSASGSAHSHTVTGATSTSISHDHGIILENNTGLTAVQFDGVSSTLAVAGGATVANSIVNSGAHAHGVSGQTAQNEATHTHTIPSLTLNAPSAIFESGMSRGVHVYVDNGSGLVDETTPLAGPWGSGSALDVSNLDITAYITGTGWKEVQLSSTTIGGITPQIIFQWIGSAI